MMKDLFPLIMTSPPVGETTVYGSYISIFQQPAANLTAEEIDLHRKADVAFGDQFVTSPH
jgi:hypothetical protein